MANYKRRDSNHDVVKLALLDGGCVVRDVSYQHGLGCDLIVQTPGGRIYFVEIKAPGRKPRLTDSELALQKVFPANYVVIQTPETACMLVGA